MGGSRLRCCPTSPLCWLVPPWGGPPHPPTHTVLWHPGVTPQLLAGPPQGRQRVGIQGSSLGSGTRPWLPGTAMAPPPWPPPARAGSPIQPMEQHPRDRPSVPGAFGDSGTSSRKVGSVALAGSCRAVPYRAYAKDGPVGGEPCALGPCPGWWWWRRRWGERVLPRDPARCRGGCGLPGGSAVPRRAEAAPARPCCAPDVLLRHRDGRGVCLSLRQGQRSPMVVGLVSLRVHLPRSPCHHITVSSDPFVLKSVYPCIPKSPCPQIPLSPHRYIPRSLCPHIFQVPVFPNSPIPMSMLPGHCVAESLCPQIPVSPHPQLQPSQCPQIILSPTLCPPVPPRTLPLPGVPPAGVTPAAHGGLTVRGGGVVRHRGN